MEANEIVTVRRVRVNKSWHIITASHASRQAGKRAGKHHHHHHHHHHLLMHLLFSVPRFLGTFDAKSVSQFESLAARLSRGNQPASLFGGGGGGGGEKEKEKTGTF